MNKKGRSEPAQEGEAVRINAAPQQEHLKGEEVVPIQRISDDANDKTCDQIMR